MVKKSIITVKDVNIRTMTVNGIDYICITDIARQKNETEPKDVVKNWMRQKNTLEYLGLCFSSSFLIQESPSIWINFINFVPKLCVHKVWSSVKTLLMCPYKRLGI